MTGAWPPAVAGSSGVKGALAGRRACLAVAANPAPWHEYLVRWAGTLADGTRLVIDYVPDRQVLVPEAVAAYLAALAAAGPAGLESLVVTVVDDLNNELVPRWVQVAAHRQHGTIDHHVTADDRQPDWDNPGLLARLGSVPVRE